MHRDVKPGNIMIDHVKKEVKLIDWGLAEYFHMDKDYNVKVASREYKGPELLVNIREYDYSLDVFSLGCVMANMILKAGTFFRGKDNFDQLRLLSMVLGSEGLQAYHTKYGSKLNDE